MVIELTNYKETLFQLLNNLKSKDIFSGQEKIIIKPNLVGPFAPPTTTDVNLIEALVKYIWLRLRLRKAALFRLRLRLKIKIA